MIVHYGFRYPWSHNWWIQLETILVIESDQHRQIRCYNNLSKDALLAENFARRYRAYAIPFLAYKREVIHKMSTRSPFRMPSSNSFCKHHHNTSRHRSRQEPCRVTLWRMDHQEREETLSCQTSGKPTSGHEGGKMCSPNRKGKPNLVLFWVPIRWEKCVNDKKWSSMRSTFQTDQPGGEVSCPIEDEVPRTLPLKVHWRLPLKVGQDDKDQQPQSVTLPQQTNTTKCRNVLRCATSVTVTITCCPRTPVAEPMDKVLQTKLVLHNLCKNPRRPNQTQKMGPDNPTC